MTGLDKIFEMSNLDEDKKKSKKAKGEYYARYKSRRLLQTF